MVFQLNSMKDGTMPDPSTLDDLSRNVTQVIGALRNVCGDLKPPTLASFGLEKAIRSHAEAFRSAHPELKIRLELMPDGQRLSEVVRLALFRIYQSTLGNTIRHARARHAVVRLMMTADAVGLEILDDGIGFAPPAQTIELARQGRLGLAGAQERAAAIGGRMDIHSSPGKGTRVRVTVPL
jgi:signal transduction histidine kinase